MRAKIAIYGIRDGIAAVKIAVFARIDCAATFGLASVLLRLAREVN